MNMEEETTVFSVEDKMDEMVSQMTNLMTEMKTMVTEKKRRGVNETHFKAIE